MDIYAQVIRTVDATYHNELGPMFQHPSLSYNQDAQPITLDPQDGRPPFLTLLNSVLEYPDEMLHVSLYEWLLCKNLVYTLINIEKPSVEAYLLEVLDRSNQSIMILDLLWKHYESMGNYYKAAQTLNKMATKKQSDLTLQYRIELVTRAVANMLKVRHGFAPYIRMMLQDLQDKLDISRVQTKILLSVTPLVGIHPKAADAVVALNSDLYHISELYEKFADPFQLWECQLAIIDCAEYIDRNFLENIWKHIIKEEISKVNVGRPNEAMSRVLAKVNTIAETYGHAAYCFPLEYIVRNLEVVSVGMKADKSLVPRGLVDMAIPFRELLDVYNKFFISSVENEFWKKEENQLHLPEAIASLITVFLDHQGWYTNLSRRKIIAQCQECVTAMLPNVLNKQNADGVLKILQNIKFRLSEANVYLIP